MNERVAYIRSVRAPALPDGAYDCRRRRQQRCCKQNWDRLPIEDADVRPCNANGLLSPLIWLFSPRKAEARAPTLKRHSSSSDWIAAGLRFDEENAAIQTWVGPHKKINEVPLGLKVTTGTRRSAHWQKTRANQRGPGKVGNIFPQVAKSFKQPLQESGLPAPSP